MGQRLLLVDSDRSFLKEHQVSLEAAFDLEVASSPEGVVARVEPGGFAAVLICVEVADNKGYALCSTLRKQPSLALLKIALISSKATEEEFRRHQSLKGRADLYLHKPIAPSALVAALRPLVPGRVLDPDNPLGELADGELGDDWLDSLKGELDVPAAPQAAPAPTKAPAAKPLPARATAPTDTTRSRLLEEQLAALREELSLKDQRLQEAEAELHRQIGSVTLNLDELTTGAQETEALKARLAEAEAALAARDRDLEDLTRQQSALEGVHQAALLEVASYKEKAHLLQLELAGMDATLRGQGRDLAELGTRLQQVEGELEASRAAIADREHQLVDRQDEHQRLMEEAAQLRAQAAGLRQQLDESSVQHDGERLELMNGLDQKEAELNRLARSLADQHEAHAALEREKQAVHGQLSEHRDRLKNLDVLLQEVQERLRRGSDLARG